MKTLKSHQGLLFFTLVLSFIVSIIGLTHAMPILHAALSIYWINGIGILAILLSPLGGLKLNISAESPPQEKLGKFILRVFALELAVLLIFCGVANLSGQVLPIFNTPSFLTTQTLHETFIHLGLFPWSEIAILSCLFGYYSHQHQDAYLSTLYSPLLKSKVDNSIGIMVNTSARAATIFALSSTLAFTALLILSLFFPHLISGLNIISLIVYSLLIFMVSRKFIKKPIYFLTVNKRLHPFTALLLILITLICGLSVLNLFFSMPIHAALKTPSLIQHLLHFSWQMNWHIFSFLWWLSWIPLLAIFIAYFARGYSFRTIIIVTLFLPLLISLGLLWHPSLHLMNGLNHLSKGWAATLALVGTMILIVTIARKEIFALVMQSYLPKADSVKFRSPDQFLGTILQFSTLITCFYLSTGIILLNLFFMVFLLTLSILGILLVILLILKFRHC